uniref:Chitin-binding type-2 domain-containing protein n=1 Tax=Glossina brevipalpis TaxID=37001 RepID=A0A1A9WAM4_9MUSC
MAKDLKLFLLVIVANVNYISSQWPVIMPQCPPGYELRIYFCHYVETQPNQCQQGCYGLPVTTDLANSTATIPSDTEITATTVLQQKRCPHDSVFMDEKCRKIICTMGEYYQGQCLQPACPPGLVWRSRRCQKPGYFNTIIEIDNVLINKIRDKAYNIIENSSDVIHYNNSRETTSPTNSYTTTTKPRRITTTMKPTHYPRFTTTKRPGSKTTTIPGPKTTTKPNKPTNPTNFDCCTVVTPRICKLYFNKWVCFNRRDRTCTPGICTASVVHLKAPEIRYKYPLLIMPPNPNLTNCEENNCDSLMNNDTIDCSGCAHSNFSKCSSYCYRYMCPANSCAFMDLKVYCSNYSGKFGCLEQDGCIWNWC